MKCLLGMTGLDVHSKGIRNLARLLREAGHEVVYVGEHNSPRSIVRAALEEDAKVIGVSFSSAGYLEHVRALMQAIRDEHATDIAVMVGGLIPDDDVDKLRTLGVSAVFGPRSNLEDVTAFLDSLTTTRPESL